MEKDTSMIDTVEIAKTVVGRTITHVAIESTGPAGYIEGDEIWSISLLLDDGRMVTFVPRTTSLQTMLLDYAPVEGEYTFREIYG